MFFMSDRFFRGLRLVLALESKNVVVGEVVLDIIENEYLPALQDALLRTQDESESRELQDLFGVWEQYGDRRSKGSIWNEKATQIISAVGNKFRMSESQKEDMAGDAAALFYTRPKGRKALLAYDYMKGPEGLMKLFNTIVTRMAMDIARKAAKRHETEIEQPERIMDVSETDLTRAEIKETKREMAKWVMNKLPSKSSKLLFRMWQKIAEKRGPEKVNFDKDIIPEWTELTDRSNAAAYREWKKIKQLIVDYLRDVEGLELGPRALRKLKVADRVASTFWRRRWASWMLEILRARRA